MCPLCFSKQVRDFATVDDKQYRRCEVCHLTFMSSEYYLDEDAELARYQLHENSPDDLRYREFLSRLSTHLTPKLPAAAEGLDFGSGPGPTLSVMLEEQGFRVNLYDPFFAPSTDALQSHIRFHHVHGDGGTLLSTGKGVSATGRIAAKRGLARHHDRDVRIGCGFRRWRYHREPTHVCFYKRETMIWIADQHTWKVEFPQKNVTLFQKA